LHHTKPKLCSAFSRHSIQQPTPTVIFPSTPLWHSSPHQVAMQADTQPSLVPVQYLHMVAHHVHHVRPGAAAGAQVGLHAPHDAHDAARSIRWMAPSLRGQQRQAAGQAHRLPLHYSGGQSYAVHDLILRSRRLHSCRHAQHHPACVLTQRL
jgi:hypothetical protein